MTAKTAIWRRVFLIGFLPSRLTAAELKTVPHAWEKGAGAAQDRPGRLPAGAGSAPGLAPAALLAAGRSPVPALAKHVALDLLPARPRVGEGARYGGDGDDAQGEPAPAPGSPRHEDAVHVGRSQAGEENDA